MYSFIYIYIQLEKFKIIIRQPLRNKNNSVCLFRAFSTRFSGDFRSAVISINSNVKMQRFLTFLLKGATEMLRLTFLLDYDSS